MRLEGSEIKAPNLVVKAIISTAEMPKQNNKGFEWLKEEPTSTDA